MIKLYYDVLKPFYGDCVKLMYMDTDSFVLDIQTEDVYQDIAQPELFKYFDTTEHSKIQHHNKKVPGKLKDETLGDVIVAFAGLRAKMYSFETCSGAVAKKAKGLLTKSLNLRITKIVSNHVAQSEHQKIEFRVWITY